MLVNVSVICLSSRFHVSPYCHYSVFHIIILLTWQVQIVALNEDTSEFEGRCTFDHPYPTTKIMWIPDSVSTSEIILCIFRYQIRKIA